MESLLAYTQVALGLGFVIFVHELGHFLVAKACGVRCDKFMVGFDIGGLKIGKHWGETFYGIGILPLGGYVKMFGQEDNAAAMAEEMERSKTLEGSPDAKAMTGPDGKTVWIDKRSYLAKNVPQRMAIISAGVVMNVIFAFIMAWIAFGLGVPERAAVASAAETGMPAWRAGVRTGDRILQINEVADPSYQELVEEVVLGDPERGVAMRIQSADGSTRELNLLPDTSGQLPRIGFLPGIRPVLAAKDAVVPNTPAAELGDNGFRDGDYIAEVDGKPIAGYADLNAALYKKMGDPLTYTVIRGGKPPAGDPFGQPTGGERVELTVGPNRMERLGVVPTLGPVEALVTGSPAEEAGVEVGDQIVAVDGARIGAGPSGEETIDPLLLNARLATAAERGEAVTLTLQRGEESIEVGVTPQVVTWRSGNSLSGPFAFDALGVACVVRPVVASVVADSPAESADLRPGDHILSVTFRSDNPADRLPKPEIQVEFKDKIQNWAALLPDLQDRSADFSVELRVARPASETGELAGGEPTHTVTLKPATVDEAYMPNRGVQIQRLERMRIANGVGEQTELAWEVTTRALTTVLRFVQGLFSGQVSLSGAGGPITIAAVAGEAAHRGLGALLMSLVMLSANLAVLNFLPIPVLDGGHMVFLAYEGVTGRPPNEKVLVALQTVGLVMLLSLMLFVTSMDISRLISWAM